MKSFDESSVMADLRVHDVRCLWAREHRWKNPGTGQNGQIGASARRFVYWFRPRNGNCNSFGCPYAKPGSSARSAELPAIASSIGQSSHGKIQASAIKEC
jgi:hypothetical protein